MGTSNFRYDNILAVITPSEYDYCSGCDEEITTEFGECPNCEDGGIVRDKYEDFEFVVDDIKNLIQEDLEREFKNNSKVYVNTSEDIAKIIIDYVEEEQVISVVLHPGYYEGASVDYCLDLVDNDKPLVQNVIKRIEKVIFRYTTKLKVVARFSNGETMYEIDD